MVQDGLENQKLIISNISFAEDIYCVSQFFYLIIIATVIQMFNFSNI